LSHLREGCYALVVGATGAIGQAWVQPKNSSYPAAVSAGGGVGSMFWPTIRWQM